MTRTVTPRGRTSGACLLLLAALASSARAQTVPPRPDLDRDPVVPPQLATTPAAPVPSVATPTNRIRLFRIQPGFTCEPLGLDPDDRTNGADDPGPDFLNVSFGNDNPFRDFRRQGDPGGVGYSRLNTQVQLFESETTALALGFQAVAPAGAEFDGLPNQRGATVLTPALSFFHDLDGATALQAFVGKNLPVQNSAAQAVRREVQYGMAVHRPLSTRSDDPLSCVYLSLGALGQYGLDSNSRPVMLEVLPGLHYKAGESWWISGGISVPVGSTRPDAAQLWQVTCSLQF